MEFLVRPLLMVGMMLGQGYEQIADAGLVVDADSAELAGGGDLSTHSSSSLSVVRTYPHERTSSRMTITTPIAAVAPNSPTPCRNR